MYSQNIEESLQSDICLCVERQMKRPWRQQSGSVLEICLLEKIKQYPAEFIETLKQEQFIEQKRVDEVERFVINLPNLDAFIAGHQGYFVNDCDAYYLHASALRMDQLMRIGDHNTQKIIKKLTRKLKKPNAKATVYYERGIQYMAIHEYEKAKRDFYECLKLTPGHMMGKYYLGWTCELNEDYGDAKNWYKHLIKLNNDFNSILGLELVKRKIRERDEFEELKLMRGAMMMNASASKKRKIRGEGAFVPIMKGCEKIKDQEELKKCMSEVVKNYVNKHFNISTALRYSNLKPGYYKIQTMFKISANAKIEDIKIQFPDPFIANEARRVLKSLPPIIKPAVLDGKPVGVYYQLPIAFVIKY